MKKLFSFFVFLIFFVGINKNTAFAQGGDEYFGTIANLSVEMLLNFGEANAKNIIDINGTYSYKKNDGIMFITGKLNATTKKVAMTEKNQYGKTTGFFNGTYDPYNSEGSKITGIWTSVDKKRNLKFALTRPL